MRAFVAEMINEMNVRGVREFISMVNDALVLYDNTLAMDEARLEAMSKHEIKYLDTVMAATKQLVNIPNKG